MDKIELTFKEKRYGVFFFDGRISGIRSETNPHKTPYLHKGSKRYVEIAKLPEVTKRIASTPDQSAA